MSYLKVKKQNILRERGRAFWPLDIFDFFVFTNMFALELETSLYYLSITITTDPSPEQLVLNLIAFSNFQILISNNPQLQEPL